MPRSNSDNFGDIAQDPPAPNNVPSENAQLKRRHLNVTGLPDGVRDDEREVEFKASGGDDKSQASTSVTRKRRNEGGEKVEEMDKQEDKGKSLSFTDRLRSPLGSSLNLEELRESISNGVEVKYVHRYHI